MKIIVTIFFLVLSLLSRPAQALEVPSLQGYVNDYAGMISSPVRTQLEEELKAFEQSDSTQLVILTVPSLQGEVIEEFTIKVGDTWKIGQKHKDNGIILIVAKEERKLRIEIGRGLEGRLTDLLAGRIIDLVITPRFKRGDFDGGFKAGIAALVDATRGEFKAEAPKASPGRGGHSILTFLIFGFVILLFLGSLSRILGGVAGFVGLPALVNWGLFPLGLIGMIISALVGLLLGLILPSLFSAGSGVRRGGIRSGGGFFPPIGGGGWSSGGFGGGGGFSGGGGSFGGGGSSGSW
ncbi:MAG: TPM domain-containing protein [Thermodesulfobacteriota bacterium]